MMKQQQQTGKYLDKNTERNYKLNGCCAVKKLFIAFTISLSDSRESYYTVIACGFPKTLRSPVFDDTFQSNVSDGKIIPI